jgi:endo-1,3(4)-beta-glucanase
MFMQGYGPDPTANPVQYYINPIGIKSFSFSAQELNPHTAKVSLTPTESSIDVQILDDPGLRKITFPLVQGSGFITAIYTSVTPHFDSGVGFREVIACTDPRPGVRKWRLFLEDGKTWLLYAHPVQGCVPPTLRRNNAWSITATHSFAGVFQLAKVPRGCGSFEALADRCTGTWPTRSNLTASLLENPCSTYAFEYLTEDSGSTPSPLLMYALPHHIESFDPHTASCVQHEMILWSTTKGPMRVVVAKQWVFREDNLPRHISFSPFPNSNVVLDPEERNIILATAREEAMGDPVTESNLDSMYFSGKALDKYACLCWVIVEVLDERHLGLELLAKVKEAFARFAENRQIFPLVYDGTFFMPLLITVLTITKPSGEDWCPVECTRRLI